MTNLPFGFSSGNPDDSGENKPSGGSGPMGEFDVTP